MPEKMTRAHVQQLFEKWNASLDRYSAFPTTPGFFEQKAAWDAYIIAVNALDEAEKQQSIAESWPVGIDQDIFALDFCDIGD